eukprot:3852185-Karenia_brevis.AAC.1
MPLRPTPSTRQDPAPQLPTPPPSSAMSAVSKTPPGGPAPPKQRPKGSGRGGGGASSFLYGSRGRAATSSSADFEDVSRVPDRASAGSGARTGDQSSVAPDLPA